MGATDNKRGIEDSEYNTYITERSLLIDAEREGSRLFDKAILTLTAGAFGLSLAFIRQMVPCIQKGTTKWLIIGWTGFCLSLLSTLISFLTSQAACRKQRDILEGSYFRNAVEKTNRYASATSALNIFSITGFIVGVIFLATFVVHNLN